MSKEVTTTFLNLAESWQRLSDQPSTFHRVFVGLAQPVGAAIPAARRRLSRQLVLADPLEARLAEELVGRPAPVLPLDHQPGLDPDGILQVLAGPALERRGRPRAESLARRASRSAEVFMLKPVPSLPAKTSFRALPLPSQQVDQQG
jgi:hypothetical protein